MEIWFQEHDLNDEQTGEVALLMGEDNEPRIRALIAAVNVDMIQLPSHTICAMFLIHGAQMVQVRNEEGRLTTYWSVG